MEHTEDNQLDRTGCHTLRCTVQSPKQVPRTIPDGSDDLSETYEWSRTLQPIDFDRQPPPQDDISNASMEFLGRQ